MKRIKERAAFSRPLLIPFILFIVLLDFSIVSLRSQPDPFAWWVIALLPLLPAAYLVNRLIKLLRKLDELEQKILVEATALSGLVTFFLLMIMGSLELAGVSLPNPIYLSLLMAVIVLVAKLTQNSTHR